MDKAYVIIPARGGSKGVPMKNVQLVGNTSLIARSVLAAKEAFLDSPCVVATDCPTIKEEALAYGARIINLPERLTTDNSPSEGSLVYAIEHFWPSDCSVVAFVQCTSPFVTAEDIRGTAALVQSGEYDSALAVAPFHGFIWGAGGKGITHNEDVMRVQRHRYPAKYLETGSVYAFRRKLFLETQNRFCGRTGLHISESPRLEIDEPADLVQAQLMERLYRGN